MRQSLFILALILLLPLASQAAFKSSADVNTREAAVNPAPLKDDIILPMPCGLELILRAVHVPGGNTLRDRSFAMGLASQSQPDRGFYERQFNGHIAAPFRQANLPFEWQQKLREAEDEGSWYFIGKYEISRLQWEAVMKGLDSQGNENPAACPSGGKDMNLPVTGISWFETQEFINRYNAWLVKNHRTSLPFFAGTSNLAFVRLPTEEEWEYAARGGSHVPPEWWAEKDFFPMPEGRSISDYGVYDAGSPPPAANPIGTRLANPLGLHDTAGNAREMVDGFFRMSVADLRNGQIERRLHGSAGGILAKGGSFHSQENGVLPGSRDEVPLFTARGAASASDLGFRVALGSLNIPDASRMEELRSQEEAGNKLPEGAMLEDNFSSPLEAIDALLKRDQGQFHASLEKLRNLVRDEAEARSRADADNLERAFRGLLYQAETLRSFAYRYATAYKLRAQLQQALAQNLDENTRLKAEQGLSQANADLKDYLSSLEMGASYYLHNLENLAAQPAASLDSLARQAKTEYGGAGVFNEHMRHNAEILIKFLHEAQSRQLSGASVQSILKSILPEAHYELLPLAKKGK